MESLIRKIEKEDIPFIVFLLHEFAEFEKLAEYCDVTTERLEAALFGPRSVVEGLLLLDGESVAGYALFYPSFSSFRGQLGLYLEDIYIRDQYRGQAFGAKLLKEIAGIARSRGFERIDFNVLDWNTAAIDFYKKLGAVCNEDETHFKFSDDAFRKLSETDVV